MFIYLSDLIIQFRNNKVFNNIRIVYKKEILYGENVECYYEEQNNKHIITAKSQDNINAIIELS